MDHKDQTGAAIAVWAFGIVIGISLCVALPIYLGHRSDGKRDFYVDCTNNSWSFDDKYRAATAEEAIDMALSKWGDQLHPDDPPVCIVRSYHHEQS